MLDIDRLYIGQYVKHINSERIYTIFDVEEERHHNDSDFVIKNITVKDTYSGDIHIINTSKYPELVNFWENVENKDNKDVLEYIEKAKSAKTCKVCGVDTMEEPEMEIDDNGICSFCKKEKAKYGKVEMRPSASVNLGEVDIFAKDDDFMEVTQWTNGEGYDVRISKGMNEVNYSFTMGELEALYNLLAMLDFKPTNVVSNVWQI